MSMNITYPDDDLYQKVIEIYKEYHECVKDPGKLNQFLLTLDYNYLMVNRMYIPEITPSPSGHLSEQDVFLNLNTVKAIRHASYLPMFKHDHDFFEIVYVASGSCTNIISDNAVFLKEGDLIIIPPGVSHILNALSDGVIINILFKRAFIKENYTSFFLSRNILSDFMANALFNNSIENFIVFRTNLNPCIYNIVEILLYQSKDTESSYGANIRENLLISLFLYLQKDQINHCEILKIAENARNMVQDIILYMQKNYKTVTLSELSDKFFYSRDHISRLIKTATGMSYANLLIKLRLKTAGMLLTATKLPVKDVSEAVGYYRIDQFNKIFKKHTGKTPTEYRSDTAKNKQSG